MAKEKKMTREDLLEIKHFIAERILKIAMKDARLQAEAERDPYVMDMLVSALKLLEPTLRLWALDVVYSGGPEHEEAELNRKDPKKVKVEIGTEELAQMLYEWTNQRPSPAQAAKILAKIQGPAQERLDREAFSIITELVDQNS